MATPLAEVTTITWLVYQAIAVAISIGVSYIVQALNRPKGTTVPGQQPTLSTRGSPLTLLLGRRRVAPVVCYLGNRSLKKSSDKQFYKEMGMHAICLGPVDTLYEIYDGDKRVLKSIGTINRVDSPSGSQFVVDGIGTFRIYWGEQDQPVDARLFEMSGCGSCWPGVCFIIWDNKAVNPGWIWNQVEYVAERRLSDSPLTDSAAWINRTTRPARGTIRDDGVNPAHAIWYFMTCPAPYGLGIPADQLDGGAFEALGVLCEAEHLPVNILARDGVAGTQVLTELMTEVGFFMPQVGRKLVPVPIRPPGGETLPMVTIDASIDPVPAITQQHGETSPTRSIYLINDENAEYKPSDVTEDNDAAARNRGSLQPKQVTLNNITDRLTGYEVAQRMIQDDLVDGETYTLNVMRGARNLQPGQLFTVPTFGTLRVTSRKPDFMSTRCELEAALDQYGQRLHDYYPNGVGDPRTDKDYEAEDDIIVKPFLLPDDLNPYATPSLWIFRVRANLGTIGALVYTSSNGTSYTYTGVDEHHVTGGTMNRPILFDEPSHDGGIITGDITFTPYNTDWDEVDDLSGDDAEWLAASQIAVIDDEVFLVQKLHGVAGGFRLDGFKRAQFGTTAATHAAGSFIAIFKRRDRTTFNGGVIATGVNVRIKTTPYTSTNTLPIGSASAHAITIP